MSKITIPVVAAEQGGTLYPLVDDLTNLNSQVTRVRDNGNLIVEDDQADPGQKLKPEETVILSILAEGGETENYLFGIKQPSASGSIDVPAGVPSRLFILGAVKKFSQWFASNADVWLNNTTNEIVYYNSPNPSDGLILTASESELIRQLDPVNYSFLTIEEVETLVLDPNWNKL